MDVLFIGLLLSILIVLLIIFLKLVYRRQKKIRESFESMI